MESSEILYVITWSVKIQSCLYFHRVIFHTLDISVKKKQVTSQKRSQHSQQNYHENLGLRKTLHPPKSTRLKLP